VFIIHINTHVGRTEPLQPWHLIVTIGLFYPMLGGWLFFSVEPINLLATYLPCATLIFEWFLERRGLASGILYAGTGAGGAVFPFLVSGLLSRFGYRATMVSLGIGFLCIGSISLIPVRRRIPLTTMGNPSQRVTPPRRPWRSQWRFLQSKSMLIGGLVILFIGLGNFVPSLWIPSTFY
jgi:MFS family permease